MRWLLVLVSMSLLAAAEPLPPVDQVPDPFGLGPRLALIDYLREELGVEPLIGADLAGLQAQYEGLRAERRAAADPRSERRAELARILWVDHGVAAPDGSTIAQLEVLLAAERGRIEQELARQQAAANGSAADPASLDEGRSERDRVVVAERVGSHTGADFILADGQGVSLQAIQALRSRPGRSKLEPQEIAARCASSVTLIFTEHGTGTGFFVNQRGLMLTCAHVLPQPGGKLGVKHHSVVDGRRLELISAARLVAVDPVADLALLQVETDAATDHVVLESGNPVVMGEAVSVIGNPGIIGAVLDQTMTQGIVSSPAREINGVTHIQTNAAVNPGNSGGPMFNRRGNLIGLVVAKARSVEGVGFAVARDEIAKFLQRCVR